MKDAATVLSDKKVSSPYADTELLSRTLALGKQSYFVLDAETNELAWPEETYRLWDLEPDLNQRITLEWVFSTIHPDDRDAVVAQNLDSKWNELTFEFRILLPNGDSRHIRSVVVRDRDNSGHVVRVFGLLQDISDERRIAGELTAKRAFLDFAIQSAYLGIWEIDLDTDEVIGNNQVITHLGYEPGALNLPYTTWTELCHPDDRAGREEAFRRHLDGESDFYEHEHRLKSKSGGWIWVLVNGQIVERHLDGRPRR